jgi:hypothetical protein
MGAKKFINILMEKPLGRKKVDGITKKSYPKLNIQVLFPHSWLLGYATIPHHTSK